MSDTETDGVEHVVTVESTQVFSADVTPPMAEFLTNDGEEFDRILRRTNENAGLSLDFEREEKVTYECNCGRRFRKPETAREHLEEVRSDG